MSPDKLIRMANQIASFFRSYPEEQAVSGIHKHIAAFWTPGMRSALLSVASREGHGLDPLVAKAVLSDPAGRNPIEKELAGPDQIGQLGSDAG